jgi:hypothetical protein
MAEFSLKISHLFMFEKLWIFARLTSMQKFINTRNESTEICLNPRVERLDEWMGREKTDVNGIKCKKGFTQPAIGSIPK